MRSPLRWALTLLLTALAVSFAAAVASAASAQLTVTPGKAHPGGHVMLDFSPNPDVQQCTPQPGLEVKFTFDEDAIGQPAPLQANCHASEQVTIPLLAQCGPNHVFEGTLYDANNGTHGTASHTFEVTCPKPTITLVPTPSPTPSPTRSATPSPTPSPTRSATPSPTPTPTPTKTLAPVASATPLTAVSPPDFPGPGGSSRTPWVVGGILLALAGVGAAVAFLRPRAGVPVAVGASVVSVAVGAGLVLLAPADPPKPVITGSYTAGAGESCAAGDIPISGGFYDLSTPTDLLRFHPAGSSSDLGHWNTSVAVTGQGSTVCLRLGRPVVWRVRDADLPQARPDGGVSCQTPESLLGGGFAFPWGLDGLASHPEAPMRWSASDAPYTDGPAPVASVYALCAELPDSLRTYVTSGSTHGPGEAIARCFPGDAVLNGGFSGSQVQASHPLNGGWLTQTVGGGMSYAVCFHPTRSLGLRGTYTRSSDTGDARCDGSDTVLGGGWDSGSDLDGLQHFEPSGNGWKVARNGSGSATAYVLCARRWA